MIEKVKQILKEAMPVFAMWIGLIIVFGDVAILYLYDTTIAIAIVTAFLFVLGMLVFSIGMIMTFSSH